MNTFSENLRQVLRKRGISQIALENATKLDQSTISRTINGRDPKLSDVVTIARFLSVPVYELLGESETSGAEIRDIGYGADAEVWKRRAISAEQRLKDLRAALKNLWDESSETPVPKDRSSFEQRGKALVKTDQAMDLPPEK